MSFKSLLTAKFYNLNDYIRTDTSPNSPLMAAWFEPETLDDVVYKSRQSPCFGICYYFTVLPADVRMELIRSYPTTVLSVRARDMTRSELMTAARLSPVFALSTAPYRFRPEEAAELLRCILRSGKAVLTCRAESYLLAIMYGLACARKNKEMAESLVNSSPVLAAVVSVADPEWRIEPDPSVREFRAEFIECLAGLRSSAIRSNKYSKPVGYLASADLRKESRYNAWWETPILVFEPFHIWIDFPSVADPSMKYDVSGNIGNNGFVNTLDILDPRVATGYKTKYNWRYDHFPSEKSFVYASLASLPPMDSSRLRDLLMWLLDPSDRSARKAKIKVRHNRFFSESTKFLRLLRPIMTKDDYETVVTAITIAKLEGTV